MTVIRHTFALREQGLKCITQLILQLKHDKRKPRRQLCLYRHEIELASNQDICVRITAHHILHGLAYPFLWPLYTYTESKTYSAQRFNRSHFVLRQRMELLNIPFWQNSNIRVWPQHGERLPPKLR